MNRILTVCLIAFGFAFTNPTPSSAQQLDDSTKTERTDLLYNGIQLPDVWPPRKRDDSMTVGVVPLTGFFSTLFMMDVDMHQVSARQVVSSTILQPRQARVLAGVACLLCVAGGISSGEIPQPVVNTARDREAGVKTIVTVSQSTSELPRKSEGDVIELNDGRLLLVSMEFGGDGSDFAATRFVAHESSDGGHSWGRHRVITETSKGDLNVYSPNLIRAKDGGILLLFMRQHRPGLLTNHVWKSTDEGKTFSPYAEFVPKRGFALCNATVKRLASGRLLLPANPPAPGKPAETGPYAATMLYSDDDGLTWQVSDSRVELPMRGAMEPHVEQTADGRVLMVMRNQLGKLHFSESKDNGATWDPAYASPLTAPESCPELTRIPGTSDLLMIWNNSYDPKFRSHFGKRSPLTAAVSKDHGKTWRHLRDIETDPKRAFSNPGCRFTRDGRAIINYWTCEYLPNWAMQDVIDLRVAVIGKSWFYDRPSNAEEKDEK